MAALDADGTPGWRHVLVTYDGSGRGAGVSLYVDGRQVESLVERDLLAGSTRANASIYVGSRPNACFFQGVIDDVRIFNRELTANDVEQLCQWSVESLTRLSANQRTAEQQALLQRYYASVDSLARRLQGDLIVAETALREALVTRFAVAEGAISRGKRKDYRRWFINSQGQTMVVFDKSGEAGDHDLKHSFAISNCEVTFAEYKRFSEDSRMFPNENRPVHSVDWFKAAAYCNWLSQQDGIPKDQWVYDPNDENKFVGGMKIKPNYADLIGYRLPTGADWGHACRAGSVETYSFGEPQTLLPDYAQYIANAGGQSRPVGSLLPNEAGLFDMQGNLWEWTLDATEGDLSPVRSTHARILRGGAFYLDGAITHPDSRTQYTPGVQISNISFRPARTYRPSPSQTP